MNAFDFPALCQFPSESRIVTYAKSSLLDRALALIDRGVRRFFDLLETITAAVVHKRDDVRQHAVREMGHELAGAMTLADLMARAALVKKTDAAVEAERARHGGGPGGPSGPPPDDFGGDDDEPPQNIAVEINAGLDEVPQIANREAIAEIVARVPRLAQPVADGGPRWLQVARMYEEGGFAIAADVDLKHAKLVQDTIADYLKGNRDATDATAIIADLAKTTRDHAETILRTNAATAFSGGMFAQAQDRETAYHFPAFITEAVHDRSVTPICKGVDGMIAAVDDPVWKVWMPPSHYRCRRTVRPMSRADLEARGLLGEDGRVRPYYPPGMWNHPPMPGFRNHNFLGMSA